jgi:hypothetical protein
MKAFQLVTSAWHIQGISSGTDETLIDAGKKNNTHYFLVLSSVEFRKWEAVQ